jgi:hypothetical protein
MKTLELRIEIDVDGEHAADMLDDLAIDAEAGALDQAVLNLLREHLRKHCDFRDWRIVSTLVTPLAGAGGV